METPGRDRALVGLPAPSLVSAICGMHPALGRVGFLVYEPYPGVEKRLRRAALDATADELIAEVPAPRLLPELLRHDPSAPEQGRFDVAAAELSPEKLRRLAARVTSGAVLGICSRATLRSGRTVHLPMMDFRVRPGERGLAATREALRGLGLERGAILHSGRSYHFYGFDLLGPGEWLRFMARCLLLVPLTDTRYIGHRLLEGTGVLRITAGAGKPTVPVVVDCL